MLSPCRVAGPLALALALCGIVRGDAAGIGAASPVAAPRQVAIPDTSSPARLDSTAARALVDSLLHQVSAMRGLEVLRPVQVEVAGRERIRARLEELTREEQVRSRARGDERLLRYLGLLPANVDLLQLYKDLLEEQLAGMYDIDQRLLYLADWLPAELQALVVTHEITHALQDQHFSLRVRKKLGFDTSDAEAAWQGLLEGDATAVMLEASLRPFGQSFVLLADSTLMGSTPIAEALRTAMSAGAGAAQLQAAPRVVREAMLFPYERGLAYVAALYAAGGWRRVDAAYVHPPESTEQLMHPARVLEARDAPIRIDIPDVRGLLGQGFTPAVKLVLGEFDLFLYLSEYLDREIATISSEGWGGAAATLYAGPADAPEALVLYTTWDSADDATEFFGALLGALEHRYPQQSGVAELTNENRVAWNTDDNGRYQNLVQLNGMDVFCLERVPAASAIRIVQKLEQQTRLQDPTPDVRAEHREDLPWTRVSAPPTAATDSVSTLHVTLPPGWQAEALGERQDLVAAARRAGARLEVGVDRAAKDRLGAGGYAHVLAQRIQQLGTEVYVHTDVAYPRDDRQLYQHVFAQVEDGRRVVYYIGVVELAPGFGYVLVTEPEDGDTPPVDQDFYKLLDTLEVVPAAMMPAPTDQH